MVEKVVELAEGPTKILVAIPELMRSQVNVPREQWKNMMIVECGDEHIECVHVDVFGPSRMRYGPDIRRGVWLETTAAVRCLVHIDSGE